MTMMEISTYRNHKKQLRSHRPLKFKSKLKHHSDCRGKNLNIQWRKVLGNVIRMVMVMSTWKRRLKSKLHSNLHWPGHSLQNDVVMYNIWKTLIHSSSELEITNYIPRWLNSALKCVCLIYRRFLFFYFFWICSLYLHF